MGKIIARAATLLAACTLVACASARFQSVDFTALPSSADYPDAPAVVLLDEQIVELREEGGEAVADVTKRTQTRLLADHGRFVEHVGLGYNKSFDEIVSFDARAVTPDGRVHQYDKAKATDRVARRDSVLFSDERVLHVSFPSLPVGSVVEVVVKMRTKEPMRGAFVHELEGALPIERTRLEVRWPEGWDVRADAMRRGVAVPDPTTRTTIDGRPALVVERTKVAALPDEPDAPPQGLVAENVAVVVARAVAKGAPAEAPRDDAQLSAWTHAFVQERLGPAQEVPALHAEILRDVPKEDAVARVRALYRWTQEKVQYCAVSVGDGGWVPHAPDAVADVRYGDCKDKAALLRALLAVEGVPCDLVEIYAHDGAPSPYRWPVLVGNFNHMIVRARVDGREVLMDPTSRTVPFGRLPTSDQGADYLPITKAGEKLGRAPLDGPEVNAVHQTLRVALAADGTVAGRAQLELRGARADGARAELLRTGPSDLDEVVDEWMELWTRGGDVDDVRVQDGAYDGVDRPVRTDAAVRVPGVLHGAGGTKLLSSSSLLVRKWPQPAPGPRTLPLVLGPPRRSATTAHVALPAGWTVASLPPPVEIERPFARYRVAWRQDGDALELVREVDVRVPVLAAEDVEALRAFAAEADAADAAPVVLREAR